MTPRALTAGAIRSLPSTPRDERPQHGPFRDLRREDLYGCTRYVGTCDGEGLCIAEISPGFWRANKRDAVLAEGSLLDVLGPQAQRAWVSPGGWEWTVTVVEGATLFMACGSRRGFGTATELLEEGWRPA